MEPHWQDLRDEICARHPEVARGRMMSADALCLDGNVFAFFSTKGGRPGLGLRLGRDFDFAGLGLTDWQHLAPFRTKPPMKDWIVVGGGDLARWSDLTETALNCARTR